MKIIRLYVKGFRSLRDVSWEPEDLNVVIGPNATGKSNLLRLLELISVSARGGPRQVRSEMGRDGALGMGWAC